MAEIFDVREYSEAECNFAIRAFENKIAWGDESYKKGLESLRARLAELHGKKVNWVLPY